MSSKPSLMSREPTMLSNLRAQSSRHLGKLVESAKSSTKELLHQNDHVELSENPNNYTYEDLAAIEKDRRSLLIRVKRFSVINILSSFHGTVLPEIVQSPFSWFILILYVGLRYLLRVLPEGKHFPPMSLSYVSLIGGFMSFSLVFFVSQAYSRLCAQYEHSAAIIGRIYNLMFLARSNLPAVEAWRLLRYLNAIHVTAYTGLSNVYTEENLFEVMNEKYQLLTEQELQRVQEIGPDAGGAAYREIIGWSLDLLYTAYREDQQQRRNSSKSRQNTTPSSEPSLDLFTLQTMVAEILNLRGRIGTLFDFEDQPIPFVYIHVLFFLSLFYLPMATYAIAVDFPVGSFYPLPDLLGAFVVFLNIVYVVGLREIGRAMVLPYGDDTHDLSVLHYLHSAMLSSRRILSGYNAPPRSASTEEEMEQARPSKGPGFGNISSALSSFVKKFTNATSSNRRRLHSSTPPISSPTDNRTLEEEDTRFMGGNSQKQRATTRNNSSSSDSHKHRKRYAPSDNNNQDNDMVPATDDYHYTDPQSHTNDHGYVPMPTHSNQFYTFNPETNSYEPTSQLLQQQHLQQQQQPNYDQPTYAATPPLQPDPRRFAPPPLSTHPSSSFSARPSSASPIRPSSATPSTQQQQQQQQQPRSGLLSSNSRRVAVLR